MASVSSGKGGKRRILFLMDGVRKTIYLGKFPKDDARVIARYVQALVNARIGGVTPASDVVAWLSGIGVSLRVKLVRVGVLDSLPDKEKELAEKPLTLGEQLENYFARRKDVKQGTFLNWGHTRRCLLQFFGYERLLSSITVGDAEDWQRWLRTGDARKNRYDQKMDNDGLSPATVGKRTQNAIQFFQDAVKRELLVKNPFIGLKCIQQANKQRQFFVTREMAAKVLEILPDNEWRLIFALSRFAGLRCPSETLSLRWEDINWAESRMLVRVPKLERIAGKETRLIPIFPEVRPYLDTAWSEASPGAVHVIQRYRTKNANLRTQLLRFLTFAGLPTWPKPFTNLRASMSTDLVKKFPPHVEAEWVGHSEKIAKEHYLQVTNADFAKALDTEGSATHNTTQQGDELDRTGMQANLKYAGIHQKSGVFQGGAAPCNGMQSSLMGGIGFEPMTSTV